MTQQKSSAEELKRLRQIEKLFFFMLEHTSDFIYFKDDQLRFTYASQLFAKLTEHESWQQLAGKNDFDVFDKEHASHYRAIDNQVLAGENIDSHEESYFNNAGELCWVSTSKTALPAIDGQPSGLFGISRDITHLKKLEHKLKDQARTDLLTQLCNRNSFFEQGNRIIHISHRESNNAYLLFLDLDGFKEINDTYGHIAGDEVLKAIAKRLKDTFRSSDLVARYGGDEFLILVMVKDESAIKALAQKAIAVVAEPISHNGNSYQLTCSIGIAKHTDSTDSLDSLIQQADHAMYLAKRKGKQRAILFHDNN